MRTVKSFMMMGTVKIFLIMRTVKFFLTMRTVKSLPVLLPLVLFGAVEPVRRKPRQYPWPQG